MFNIHIEASSCDSTLSLKADLIICFILVSDPFFSYFQKHVSRKSSASLLPASGDKLFEGEAENREGF